MCVCVVAQEDRRRQVSVYPPTTYICLSTYIRYLYIHLYLSIHLYLYLSISVYPTISGICLSTYSIHASEGSYVVLSSQPSLSSLRCNHLLTFATRFTASTFPARGQVGVRPPPPEEHALKRYPISTGTANTASVAQC